MFEFVIFLRDSLVDLGVFLHRYTFPIGGINVSILDLLIGIIAMGIIITVFWKGAHS